MVINTRQLKRIIANEVRKTVKGRGRRINEDAGGLVTITLNLDELLNDASQMDIDEALGIDLLNDALAATEAVERISSVFRSTASGKAIEQLRMVLNKLSNSLNDRWSD